METPDLNLYYLPMTHKKVRWAFMDQTGFFFSLVFFLLEDPGCVCVGGGGGWGVPGEWCFFFNIFSFTFLE